MEISGVRNRNERYRNEQSKSEVQAQRMENYNDLLLDVLEQYTEEIQSAIDPYNRKSSEKTMMIKGARRSSHETTNRRTHTDNLEGIATEAAKKLGLRVGVTRIMARFHDIGHTFSGHSGEYWLSDVKESYGMGDYCHNALGTEELIFRHNIYDEILERIKAFNPEIKDAELKRIRKSLWLIFDGINSHNGEKTETEFVPNRSKTEEGFMEELKSCFTEKGFDKTIMPATMEGALLRLCDKISYIPYDMVDGIREGIIDKIDGDYIPLLTSLGISEQEIEVCNIKRNYEPIVRKLQITFTRDVILNSSKYAIRLSTGMSHAMHLLRNINNNRIVDFVVLKEDEKTYTRVIRSLMDIFSDILLKDDNLEKFRSGDLGFIQGIMTQYKGSNYEEFIRYMVGMTEAEYLFTEQYIKEADSKSKKSVRRPGVDCSPLKLKMSLEFGARYIATLADEEFLDLARRTSIISEEEMKSLTRKYKNIGQAGLQKEAYLQPEWGKIKQAQKQDTDNIKMAGANDGEMVH